MKKSYLFLFIIGLFAIPLLAQQNQDGSLPSTSLASWTSLMQACNLSFQDLSVECPNFPLPQNFNSDSDFTKAVHKWYKANPKEVAHFWSIEKVITGNPSPYYLGLPVQQKFEHSVWDLYKASGLTDVRLQEVAPHFPRPEISGNFEKDKEEYDNQLYRWYSLYSHEYENFYNCKEIISLNPWYNGEEKLVGYPKFMGALTSKEKPVYVNTGDPFKDKLGHELRIQNWYFVFHPDQFEKVYGFYPEFPEGFDEAAYRTMIIGRIEANEQERIRQDGQ